MGGFLRVVCDEGYWAAGNGSVACVAPGVLVGDARCEPAECGPYPAPAHGAAEPAGAARYGDAVEIRCEEGYRLAGPERAECRADGSWSEVCVCVCVCVCVWVCGRARALGLSG